MASWEEFISSAEQSPPQAAIRDRVVTVFKDVLHAATPWDAEGLTEDSLTNAITDSPPALALARRTLRNVEAAAKARRVQVSQSMALTGAGSVTASAKALAAAMAPMKTTDAQDLLSKAHLTGLQYHLQPDQALFDVLQAHTDEARKNGKTPFLFVDLTAKDTLPLWVPGDNVGGKFSWRDEEEFSLASTSPIGSLGDLTRALKSATSTPRFFRSVPQWSAAFWRWAVAAVSAQHITMPQVLAHQDVVLQLCEQERKLWARRADKKDPSFDLNSETQKLDKDLKEIVMQRLSVVVQITEVEGSGPASASSRMDEKVTQQLAAAEAAQKKAELVTKSLAAAQKGILEKAAASATVNTTTANTGGQPEERKLSAKELKTQKWFQKQKQRKEQQQYRKRGN
ncbi:unnamed protein product [Symbiodinium natans]|uniref:Uncharacterized protein n=1 Tax=Symbiodinium natans TaxID=878477 RepID=A0A812N9A1_9DINO|nr:unnamed protein product [Symbiodinium natans]